MEKLPLKSKSELLEPTHMTPVLIFSPFLGLSLSSFPWALRTVLGKQKLSVADSLSRKKNAATYPVLSWQCFFKKNILFIYF